VHEFPFWTFIFVDLHAHLQHAISDRSLPPGFQSACGKSKSSFKLGQRSISPLASARGVFISALLPILLVGTLGVISSWDYPTGVIFLLLIAALKTYSQCSTASAKAENPAPPTGIYYCVLIPGSLLLYAPFYVSFSRSQMGLDLSEMRRRGSQIFSRSSGFFFFVILSFLIVQAWRIRKSGNPWGVS